MNTKLISTICYAVAAVIFAVVALGVAGIAAIWGLLAVALGLLFGSL